MIFHNFRAFGQLISLRMCPKYIFGRNIFKNAEERQETRRTILSELRKGYLFDLKEVKANGGKRYLARDKPFSREESISLPTINGQKLSGESIVLPDNIIGNITLLLLWTRDHGKKACGIYRTKFQEEFINVNEDSQVQCYEVNLIDSWLFKMFRSYISQNLRQQLPLNRQKNFLCCYERSSEVVDKLFENTLVGHAFLIDNTGHIRWKAHGHPTEEELKYLINSTNSLRVEHF